MLPTLLGGLTPRAFLRRHWQKRPLLVRGAFPSFRDPVTPARLLALARRRDVDARLVLERGSARPWQVVPGPLTSAAVARLPESRWTVLVHDLEALVPAAARLLEEFDFLPRWRMDDVMASLAAPLGSVGPHVDSYDVFLLQGRGRRRWRIARRFEAALRPGLDLAVLRRFRAEREWVLGPGDMLYLPPGVAHHGVALEECLTYSIGLRAPAHGELVAGFLARVVAGLDRSLLYADPGLAPAREPAAIDPAALRHMRRIVSDAVACLEGPEFTRFVGEHLTEPRRETARRRLRVSAEALRRALRGGGWLSRRPGARVAFVRGRRGPVSLYADGREWPVPKAIARAVPLLARRRRLDAGTLRSWRGRPALLALLARLVTDGVFELEGRRARGATRRGRPGSRRARGSPRRGGRR